MAKTSAGFLMFRVRAGGVEVLLVHPGGPYWERKDDGAWSIPKGEFQAGEDPLDAARRELEEETGLAAQGPFHRLTPVKQPGGKVVYAWAFAGDCNPAELRSNVFSQEWPPRSGRQREFPEVDRAAWFPAPQALHKILPGQRPLVVELVSLLSHPPKE